MTIRLCTWNVWLNHGPWRERHEAIEATLAGLAPDGVALQEVYDPVDRSGSPLVAIAENLGYELIMGPPPAGFEAPVRNAIMSRLPVTDTDAMLLTDRHEHRYRSVVTATLDHADGPVQVFTTHLEHRYHLGSLRQEQLQEIVGFMADRWPEKDAFPPVLMGDLNAVPDSDEVRRLTGRADPYDAGNNRRRIFLDAWDVAAPGSDGVTWDSANPYLEYPQWPNRRLDYILIGYPSEKPLGRVANIELAGTEPVDGVTPSDHYAVVADLYTAADGRPEDR